MDKRIPEWSWIHNAFRIWLKLPNYGKTPKCPTADAYRMRADGKTVTEIAEKYGASYDTVCRVFWDCKKARNLIEGV